MRKSLIRLRKDQFDTPPLVFGFDLGITRSEFYCSGAHSTGIALSDGRTGGDSIKKLKDTLFLHCIDRLWLRHVPAQYRALCAYQRQHWVRTCKGAVT